MKKRLGDLLVDEGLISERKLELALLEQRRTDKRLGAVLVEQGVLTASQLLEFLSRKLNIRSISLSKYKLNPAVVRSIPESFAKKHHVIAVEARNNNLVVAIADPTDYDVLDQLVFSTGFKRVVPVLAADGEIENAINKYYSEFGKSTMTINSQTLAKISNLPSWELDDAEESESTEEKYATSDEADISQVIDLIFSEAVKRRATHIHFDPTSNKYYISLRIQGKINPFSNVSKGLGNSVINKLRILASVKFASKDEPQDGFFRMKAGEQSISVTFSMLPVHNGSRVVLEVTKREVRIPLLDELSFPPNILKKYKKLINQDKGFIIVTGPHNNGKLVTLYSTLNELASQHKVVFSYEDIIQEELHGVVQIKPTNSMSYNLGIQTIFKQNPDVLMLGTVPQGDTLKFVMERAQSEVLVFGKMDGLNAFTSLDSLQGLGIPPYLAALATNAVLSQQLLPQLCEKCKKPTKLSPNLMKQFQNILQTKDLNFYQRVGCDACRMTGYDGSIAIYELLSVDRKIADMVMKGASSMEIRNYALSTGMEPMKIDALRKAAMGLTTYQEVMKLK